MAPLVSVVMLLIVFFVWMKQLQRHKVVSVYAQTRGKVDYYLPVTDSLVLLGSDRFRLRQFGVDGKANYVETNCSTAELRSLVRRIALSEKPVLIIQPTAQCTIKNLVAVIDALTLNGRITYMLTY